METRSWVFIHSNGKEDEKKVTSIEIMVIYIYRQLLILIDQEE